MNNPSKFQKFKHWAYNHSDQSHPKYNSLNHSLLITLKSTIIFLIGALTFRYFYNTHIYTPLQPSAVYIGIFLQIYLCVMIGSRYIQNGYPALYQTLWACNLSILLSGIACIIGDATLIRAALVLVSADQILWYVDLLGFLITRKFYVGVAKYIIWPQTSKMRLITTFHHIWFLPLCLWVIHPTAKYSSFTSEIFVFSCALSLLLVIIGRISTPKEITVKKGENQVNAIYMNLNLSWELWKDIKVGFLARVYQKFQPKYLMVIVSFVLDIFNMPGFLIFRGIEQMTK